MPRTKQPRKRSESILNVKPNKAELDRVTIQNHLKSLDKYMEVFIAKADNEINRIHLEFTNKCLELNMDYQRENNKTIAELKATKSVSSDSTRNITASSNRTARGKVRSSSADRFATSTKKPRRSRSLRQTRNNFVTPMISHNLPAIGTVTPKVKPNAPQVILRRPKQGEMAISMQGSPLMVSGITSDYIPNINIPLNDGRMIAIQPERGLRYSDLPEFDSVTRRNLELLRDNLNKVCGKC